MASNSQMTVWECPYPEHHPKCNRTNPFIRRAAPHGDDIADFLCDLLAGHPGRHRATYIYSLGRGYDIAWDDG